MAVVTLTKNAEEHMATMLKDHDKPAIRLALKGGGCAGFKYEWSLEDEVSKDDEVITLENGKFLIDASSVMYLIGATVDYKKEVFGAYFDIKSPGATSSCGCGESVGF
jgi:iron-sulfur cluster insertion protein